MDWDNVFDKLNNKDDDKIDISKIVNNVNLDTEDNDLYIKFSKESDLFNKLSFSKIDNYAQEIIKLTFPEIYSIMENYILDVKTDVKISSFNRDFEGDVVLKLYNNFETKYIFVIENQKRKDKLIFDRMLWYLMIYNMEINKNYFHSNDIESYYRSIGKPLFLLISDHDTNYVNRLKNKLLQKIKYSEYRNQYDKDYIVDGKCKYIDFEITILNELIFRELDDKEFKVLSTIGEILKGGYGMKSKVIRGIRDKAPGDDRIRIEDLKDIVLYDEILEREKIKNAHNEGIKEGMSEGIIYSMKRMFSSGISYEDIAKVYDISIDEVVDYIKNK